MAKGPKRSLLLSKKYNNKNIKEKYFLAFQYCSAWSKSMLKTKKGLCTTHPPPQQTFWPVPDNREAWGLVYHHTINRIINFSNCLTKIGYCGPNNSLYTNIDQIHLVIFISYAWFVIKWHFMLNDMYYIQNTK